MSSTVVVERVRDDLGDWRVCVLSPRGGRIHAPWAMAAAAKIREETGVDVETLWGDDGFVVRFPDVDEPPDPRLLLPDPDEVQALVVRQLGATALFAAKFRENAARSLLLPKRRPGMRAPLWQQRKRAADLLAVASRYGSFPVLLETYRECLRDFFDMPALVSTLADVRSRRIRVAVVDSDTPSPFAASLLFSYVASFLYDGDAPLAERRAQALAVDQSQLRELLGDAELRELLDAEAMDAIERQLQRLDPKYHARSADAVHDMLLAIGDLSEDELRERSTIDVAEATRDAGCGAGASCRCASPRIRATSRWKTRRGTATRLAFRCRTAFPNRCSRRRPTRSAILLLRYARTHAPFAAVDVATRYGLTVACRRCGADAADGRRPSARRRIPPGRHDARVDGSRRAAHAAAPLARQAASRDRTGGTGGARPVHLRPGTGSSRSATAPTRCSTPSSNSRARRFRHRSSKPKSCRHESRDMTPPTSMPIAAAGEVVWIGVEPLGERDGRVALYLADHLARLLPPRGTTVRLKPDATYEARAEDAGYPWGRLGTDRTQCPASAGP